MARVRRLDLGTLASPVRRADGTMLVEARITRTGVFVYRHADGSERREYRPRDEVARPQSLDTFKLVPVTNDHPPGLLTSKNARQFSVGAVGENVRVDGNYVVATLAIHDAETIRQLEAGKLQVSCGYECEMIEKPGVSPDGERYDAVQHEIVGNHVAIVHNARAGAGASIRLDDGAVQLPYEPSDLGTIATGTAASRSTDTKPVDSLQAARQDARMPDPQNASKPDASVDALRSLEAQRADTEQRAKTAEADRDAHKLRADTAEGKNIELTKQLEEAHSKIAAHSVAAEAEAIAQEKARADAAEAKVAAFDKTFASAVRSRAKLERSAATIMGDDFRMDDLDDRTIMCEVVRRLDSAADVGKDVPEGVIKGRFLAIIDRHAATARQIAKVAEATTRNARQDANQDNVDKRRSAWRDPLPNARK